MSEYPTWYFKDNCIRSSFVYEFQELTIQLHSGDLKINYIWFNSADTEYLNFSKVIFSHFERNTKHPNAQHLRQWITVIALFTSNKNACWSICTHKNVEMLCDCPNFDHINCAKLTSFFFFRFILSEYEFQKTWRSLISPCKWIDTKTLTIRSDILIQFWPKPHE